MWYCKYKFILVIMSVFCGVGCGDDGYMFNVVYYDSEWGYYMGIVGDGSEWYYVSYGGDVNGLGGEFVIYLLGEVCWSCVYYFLR